MAIHRKITAIALLGLFIGSMIMGIVSVTSLFDNKSSLTPQEITSLQEGSPQIYTNVPITFDIQNSLSDHPKGSNDRDFFWKDNGDYINTWSSGNSLSKDYRAYISNLGTTCSGLLMNPLVYTISSYDIELAKNESVAFSHYDGSWLGNYAPADTEYRIVMTADKTWDVKEIGIQWCSLYLGDTVVWEDTTFHGEFLWFNPNITRTDWQFYQGSTASYTPLGIELNAVPFLTEGDLRIYEFDILGSDDYYTWNTVAENLQSQQYHTEFEHTPFWTQNSTFPWTYYTKSQWDALNPVYDTVYNEDTSDWGCGLVTTADDMSWQDPSWNDVEWYELDPEDQGYKYYQIKLNNILFTGGSMYDCVYEGEIAFHPYKVVREGSAEEPYGYPEIGQILMKHTIEGEPVNSASIGFPKNNSIMQVTPFDIINLQMNAVSETSEITSIEFYFDGNTASGFEFDPRELDDVYFDDPEEVDKWYKEVPTEIDAKSELWINASALDASYNGWYVQDPRAENGGNNAYFDFIVYPTISHSSIYDIDMIVQDIGSTSGNTPYMRTFDDDAVDPWYDIGTAYERHGSGDITELYGIDGKSYDFTNESMGDYFQFTAFPDNDSYYTPQEYFYTNWEYGGALTFTFMPAGATKLYDIQGLDKILLSVVETIYPNDLFALQFTVDLWVQEKDTENMLESAYIQQTFSVIIAIMGGFVSDDEQMTEEEIFIALNAYHDPTVSAPYRINYMPSTYYDQAPAIGEIYTFGINNLEMFMDTLIEQGIADDTLPYTSMRDAIKDVHGYEMHDFKILQHEIADDTGIYETMLSNVDEVIIEDFYRIDDIGYVNFPILESSYNRFRLLQQDFIGNWKVIDEIAPTEDLNNYKGNPNLLYIVKSQGFKNDPFYYILLSSYLYGKNYSIHFDAIPIQSGLITKFRIEWIMAFGIVGEYGSSPLYYVKPDSNLFQFGSICVTDIEVHVFSAYNTLLQRYDDEHWYDRFYDIVFPLSIGTTTPNMPPNLRYGNIKIRNLWDGCRHSANYEINRMNTIAGEFTTLISSSPPKPYSTYAEVDLYFPTAGYYDLYLTRELPYLFTDSNLYNFYVDGELYRKSHQLPKDSGSLLSTIAQLLGEQTGYEDEIFYEQFYQYPSAFFKGSYSSSSVSSGFSLQDLLMTFSDTKNGYSGYLRAASGFFEAGSHTLRVEFAGFDTRYEYSILEGYTEIMDPYSYIGLDTAVLFHRSFQGFGLPVWYIEDYLQQSTATDIHNVTMIVHTTSDTITTVNYFKLNSNPIMNFRGGNFPEIFVQDFDDSYLRQLQYMNDEVELLKIGVKAYDNDIDDTTFRWRLNNGEWNIYQSVTEVAGIYTLTSSFLSTALQYGKNVIEAVCSDKRGHTTQSFLIVYKDNVAPNIQITDIQNMQNNNGRYGVGQDDAIITIRVTDPDYGQLDRIEYAMDLRSFSDQSNAGIITWIPLYDRATNLTEYRDLTLEVNIPICEFAEGNGTLYFRAIDVAGNEYILPMNVSRKSYLANMDVMSLQRRYVAVDPTFIVHASNYKIKLDGPSYTISRVKPVNVPRTWINVGHSDIGSYDYVAQPFVADYSVITQVKINVENDLGEAFNEIPVVVEITTEGGNEILSRGYGYPRVASTAYLRIVDLPDVIVEVGKIYELRVYPLAQYNIYRVGFTPSKYLEGVDYIDAYGFLNGLDVPIGVTEYGERSGRLNYAITYRNTELEGSAGDIRWQLNGGIVSNPYPSGYAEIIIPKEQCIHGLNELSIFIDNSGGLIKRFDESFVWINSTYHTPPITSFNIPQPSKVYRDNMTIEVEFEYPEYQENYTMDFFFRSDKTDGFPAWIWIGRSIIPEDTYYNVGYFTFNTTELINDAQWVRDTTQAELLVFVNDTFDTYQVKSSKFTINNNGPEVEFLSPEALTRYNKLMQTTIEVKVFGAELSRAGYYFDDKEVYLFPASPIAFREETGVKIFTYNLYIDVTQLKEGKHTVNFVAYDQYYLGSRNGSASLEFIVDRTNVLEIDTVVPFIGNPYEDQRVLYFVEPDHARLRVFLAFNERYGISGFKIVGVYTGDAINGTVNLGKLAVGTYRVILLMTDEAGNEAQTEYFLEVTETGALYSVGERVASILGVAGSIFGTGVSIAGLNKYRKRDDYDYIKELVE